MKRNPSSSVDPGLPRTATATLRSMQVGQHVIAVVLAGVGAARAFVGNPALAPIVAAAAVLLWYGAGVVLSRRFDGPAAARWWLVGLTALWVLAAVLVSSEFVWFAFVLWLLAGHLLSRWVSVGFSLLVFAVVVVAPVLRDGVTTYANIFGPLIGGVFALGISRGYLELRRDAAERERLVESLTLAQTEMSALQEELALTQRHSGAIAERTRMARDIHDTIAQGLSSIRLLVRAELDRDNSPAAARTLGQVEALAGDNLADVRRIVAELTPSELEDNALAAALTRMLGRLELETGITTELRVDDTLPTLPTAHEVALLRTAQSALANVRLHAGATRVVMSLLDGDDTVRLDVVDDGHGFDAGAWSNQPSAIGSSYGLRFMRSRLREQGGGLEVESSPGEGTALSAHLPITARRRV
ncbi:MAG: sensor histidine kinase [Propionibacteriaceae bacterium]|nr:sensor histidine kinase [Propionibacteriaceae bacterium]